MLSSAGFTAARDKMSKPTFREITRVQLSDTVWAVLSTMKKETTLIGYSIGRYIDSEGYTGFTKNPIVIPEDLVVEFLKMFELSDLEAAAGSKANDRPEET